jgi:hypothetical protein
MRSTVQNTGVTLSIGLFFTIMVAGLSARLPVALSHGLTAEGLSPSAAARVADLPPVAVLFAAFLGYNPLQTLLGPAIKTLSPAHQAVLTGHSFFSSLISGPFHHGLAIVFSFALVICLIAAAASWLRGAVVRPAPDSSLPQRDPGLARPDSGPLLPDSGLPLPASGLPLSDPGSPLSDPGPVPPAPARAVADSD